VVGGGHNGLVAAFYLAKRGVRVVVLERRDVIGGACVTEEFAPGFRASPGAYVLSMLRPAIWRDMRLLERGLVVSPAGPSVHLYPDGSHLWLHNDSERATQEIARLSRRDARLFPRFKQRLEDLAQAILPLFDQTPPDPRGKSGRDLRDLASFAIAAFRNRKLLPELVYLFSTSAAQYLSEWFESEELKAAIGWDAISNTLAGPLSPGTAYVLLHEFATAGIGGEGRGWGFVRNGMGEVTKLMESAAIEAGATVKLGAEVERILTRNGRVIGVGLVGGEEVGAPIVVSNADPKRTFLQLLDGCELPLDFSAGLHAYRCEGASLKINLAVAELPQVRGLSNDREPYDRSLIQLTSTLMELDSHQALAARGIPAEDPHVEMCIPSVHDSSLAPPGKHVITIGVRSQPYRLSNGSWDQVKDQVADRIVAKLGRFFPNLPGSILHRQVLTPLDLERLLYLTGGHHMHGDMTPDQLFFMRPIRGYGDYRTPVGGLYLCGAGTHPGGGVTGANGRNCAREIMRDVRRIRSETRRATTRGT
jgi:phytoene dehydrogenase-like protein